METGGKGSFVFSARARVPCEQVSIDDRLWRSGCLSFGFCSLVSDRQLGQSTLYNGIWGGSLLFDVCITNDQPSGDRSMTREGQVSGALG